MLKSGGSILDANPGSDLDAIQHFAGADGAVDLDLTQSSYFIDLLVTNPGLNASQFGIY